MHPPPKRYDTSFPPRPIGGQPERGPSHGQHLPLLRQHRHRTTTPENLLTIDTGSGNTAIALARIKGKSPAWIFGSSVTGYYGGETYVGLVTAAATITAVAAIGDSFFLNSPNNGRMFIGRTGGNVPVTYVDNSTSSMAIGFGATAAPGRIAAAGPITVQVGGVNQTVTGVTQLQGGAPPTGTRTLTVAYGGPYKSIGMLDSAFVQVEKEGATWPYYPLRLQPIGGAVYIGDVGGTQSRPDVDSNGGEAENLLQVVKGISDVPTGGKTFVMARFDMRSQIPQGTNNNDTSCGSFFVHQDGGGAWMRALEAQTVRYSQAADNKTWGIEIGVYNEADTRSGDADSSVGIFLAANNPEHARIPPEPPHDTRQLNTAILIEGESTHSEDGGHGWNKFILCRKGIGIGNDPDKNRFVVDRLGTVWAKGDITAVDNMTTTNLTATGGISATGDVLSNGDIAAFNTVQAGAEMYATQFIVASSATVKENIVPVDDADALGMVAQLSPVTYNIKGKPDRTLIGFIAEQTPPPLSVDSKGVDVMAVVAALVRVVQQLQARVEALEKGTATP